MPYTTARTSPSAPGAPPLPREATDALVRLWTRTFADDAPPPSCEELREPAHAVATAGRAAGLRAEQLLVAIKESWARRSHVVDAQGRERVQWVLDQTISLAISAYYGDTPRSLARIAPRPDEPARPLPRR